MATPAPREATPTTHAIRNNSSPTRLSSTRLPRDTALAKSVTTTNTPAFAKAIRSAPVTPLVRRSSVTFVMSTMVRRTLRSAASLHSSHGSSAASHCSPASSLCTTGRSRVRMATRPACVSSREQPVLVSRQSVTCSGRFSGAASFRPKKKASTREMFETPSMIRWTFDDECSIRFVVGRVGDRSSRRRPRTRSKLT